MTPSQLSHLRGNLEARQAELEDLLRHREAIAVDLNADAIDEIQHALERDLAIANLERDYARLRQVRAALLRIHLGTFGICLGCEKEISPKRLAAVPWTTSCLGCQEAEDRNRILTGHLPEGPLLDFA